MLSYARVENLTNMNNMWEDCMHYSYKIEATKRKLQNFLKVKGNKRIYIQKEGLMNYSDIFTYSQTEVIQVNEQVVMCDILQDM